MQKRLVLMVFLFLLTINFIGCTSDKEIQAIRSENITLKSNIDKLNKENVSLKNDIDELKNGAERQLNEIKAAFSKKDYDGVIQLSQKLSEMHPGSKKVIESQKIVSQVNAIKGEEKKKAQTETERIQRESEKSAMEKAREIIRVKSDYPSEPNSAGGVDLHIIWQNTSKKVIKYASFEVNAYNAVNDIVGYRIKGNEVFRGKITGPVNPNEWKGEDTLWECAWYNNTVTRVEITKIDIEYVDGISTSVGAYDIKYVLY